MQRPKHGLFDDFPDYRDRIERLKKEDPEFARMASEYHELDHHVRGLEMRNVPTTDDNYESLKLRRVKLKDELYTRMTSTG